MPDPTTKPSTGTAAAGAAASGGKAGASGGAYGANSVSLRVLTHPWCTSAGSDRTEFAWRGGGYEADNGGFFLISFFLILFDRVS